MKSFDDILFSQKPRIKYKFSELIRLSKKDMAPCVMCKKESRWHEIESLGIFCNPKCLDEFYDKFEKALKM